jgi:hypothetical protein
MNIRVWGKSRGVGRCKGCGAGLQWFRTIATDRALPFESRAVPIGLERVDPHGEPYADVVFVMAAADNHWAHCPAADRFRRRRDEVEG